MTVRLKRWDNSLGIRIPKSLLDSLALAENTDLEIGINQDNRSLLLKADNKYRLSEMLKYVPDGYEEEWDCGAPVVKEMI